MPSSVKIEQDINTIAAQNLARIGPQKPQEAKKCRTFVKYWELIADNLSKAGWSWGCVVSMDSEVETSVSLSNPTAQITLVQETGSAEAQPNMTIEIDDVDAVHAKAVRLGLKVVYPLTDEPWDVRRFFVTDPNSVIINVMNHQK